MKGTSNIFRLQQKDECYYCYNNNKVLCTQRVTFAFNKIKSCNLIGQTCGYQSCSVSTIYISPHLQISVRTYVLIEPNEMHACPKRGDDTRQR